MNSSPSHLAHARSFLFVPADRPERLIKALSSGAHAVIVDLEDAVAAPAKPMAREALARAWRELPTQSRLLTLVRINAQGTEWHDDDVALLQELGRLELGGVVLPKAESVGTIGRLAEASIAPVLPLIESAKGLHAIDLLARTSHVLRLAFGHLDFQLDVGLECSPEESELDSVRLSFAIASRRAGLPPPVDGVTAAIGDAARLAADVARSRRFGFRAKLCIHPNQVLMVNEGLGPTPAQFEWARRVLETSRAHASGAFRLDGEMIDAPVLLRAHALLAS